MDGRNRVSAVKNEELPLMDPQKRMYRYILSTHSSVFLTTPDRKRTSRYASMVRIQISATELHVFSHNKWNPVFFNKKLQTVYLRLRHKIDGLHHQIYFSRSSYHCAVFLSSFTGLHLSVGRKHFKLHCIGKKFTGLSPCRAGIEYSVLVSFLLDFNVQDKFVLYSFQQQSRRRE